MASLRQRGLRQAGRNGSIEEDVRFSLPAELIHASALQLRTACPRYESALVSNCGHAAASVDHATLAARRRLTFSPQRAEGYWCAELTADTTLESDFILLQLWRHPPSGRSLEPANPRAQIEQGRTVHSGAADCPMAVLTSTTKVLPKSAPASKAYFALKLAGCRPE